jgi:hypothetical protein
MSDICKPCQAQQLAVNIIDNLINGISLRLLRIWHIFLLPRGAKVPIGIYQNLLKQYLDHQLGIFIDLVDFLQYLTKGNVDIQAVSCAGHIHLLQHLLNMNQGILHVRICVEIKAQIEESKRVLRVCFSAVMLSWGVNIEISLLDRILFPIGCKPSFSGYHITNFIADLSMIFEIKSFLGAEVPYLVQSNQFIILWI